VKSIRVSQITYSWKGVKKMLRTLLRFVSALVVIVAGMWIAPRVSGQTFVGTPIPEQFSRQGQPSTQNGEWPNNTGDLKGTAYSLPD
jgi:hypothetical protein